MHRPHDLVFPLLVCIHIISQTLLGWYDRTVLAHLDSDRQAPLSTPLFFSRRNGARYGLRLCEVLLSFGSVCTASIPPTLSI